MREMRKNASLSTKSQGSISLWDMAGDPLKIYMIRVHQMPIVFQIVDDWIHAGILPQIVPIQVLKEAVVNVEAVHLAARRQVFYVRGGETGEGRVHGCKISR